MMKRSHGIHLFICLALAMTVGCFFILAIHNASIFYGVECIVATVAAVLNIACDYDKDEKK